MDLEVEWVPQEREQLGRQLVHDPQSKAFPAVETVDRSQWVSKLIRIIDPRVNPNQCHGECTGCAKAMQFNAVGNRVLGAVFDMDDAHQFYHLATQIDPFKGTWPPEDTGSSGLASAKAAQKLGVGGEYRHVLNGADGVVELIQQNRVPSIGTWWYDGLYTLNAKGIIEPTGRKVGGHQFIARGYEVKRDLVMIRCWWGRFRDAFIKREHLNELILDGGDAHIQDRIIPA